MSDAFFQLIGAIGSALINAGSTTANNHLDYSQNRKLMKYQNEMNIENRRNAYQDTVYSMRQAGINPLYSVTGGTPQTATVGLNSAKPQAPMVGTDIMNGLTMLSQARKSSTCIPFNATSAFVALV